MHLLGFVRARDGEIGNVPVLSVEPENEIHTTNVALRLAFIVTKELFQARRENVFRRCIRGRAGLGCYVTPIDFVEAVLRVLDARGGRKRKDAQKGGCRKRATYSTHDPGS